MSNLILSGKWNEIFDEFFEGLDEYEAELLDYSFSYASSLVMNDDDTINLIQSWKGSNNIELAIYPIIYGVFMNTKEPVFLDEILPIILHETETKYDSDFVIKCVRRII